jgi:hypothetical protein
MDRQLVAMESRGRPRADFGRLYPAFLPALHMLADWFLDPSVWEGGMARSRGRGDVGSRRAGDLAHHQPRLVLDLDGATRQPRNPAPAATFGGASRVGRRAVPDASSPSDGLGDLETLATRAQPAVAWSLRIVGTTFSTDLCQVRRLPERSDSDAADRALEHGRRHARRCRQLASEVRDGGGESPQW